MWRISYSRKVAAKLGCTLTMPFQSVDVTQERREPAIYSTRSLLIICRAATLSRTLGPIGPCHAHPSQSATLDCLTADGVALIGDAAGFTDPIVGHGLSVTLRDARVVGDTLLADSDWSAACFSAYQGERRELVRRIDCIARFSSTLFVNFVDNEQRARALTRMEEKPELGQLLMAI